jgi:enoyl-CoA hydratase/carnithine racemase
MKTGDEQSMTVSVEDRDQGVRVVLLDRPAKRNAIDASVVEGVREALDTAPGTVVVLGSTDPSAFSAGVDLGLSELDRAAVSDRLYSLYQAMRATPIVLLAAASGHAVGGGAQLLIACDIRIVDPSTSIRFMGPGHGLAVGAWGLPSLVGRGRAMDLCLSMRSVDSAEALQIGLVDRVVEEPLEAALAYAATISHLDDNAVAAVKRVVATWDRVEALRLERDYNAGWDGSVGDSPRRT